MTLEISPTKALWTTEVYMHAGVLVAGRTAASVWTFLLSDADGLLVREEVEGRVMKTVGRGVAP